jgi:hypothetical protein
MASQSRSTRAPGHLPRQQRRRPARARARTESDSWVSKNPTIWEVGTALGALAALGGAPSTLAVAAGRAGQGAKLIAALLRLNARAVPRSTAVEPPRAASLLAAETGTAGTWDMGHGTLLAVLRSRPLQRGRPSATQRQRCWTRLTPAGIAACL